MSTCWVQIRHLPWYKMKQRNHTRHKYGCRRCALSWKYMDFLVILGYDCCRETKAPGTITHITRANSNSKQIERLILTHQIVYVCKRQFNSNKCGFGYVIFLYAVNILPKYSHCDWVWRPLRWHKLWSTTTKVDPIFCLTQAHVTFRSICTLCAIVRRCINSVLLSLHTKTLKTIVWR